MDMTPALLNVPRLQAMMDRRGVDLLILRGVENSKYMSDFFHNGGSLGYRPFTVFYFRDPVHAPALVVPAVDLHLAISQSWIGDVRAYAMAEFFTDLPGPFHDDFFAAAKAILAERGVRGMTIGTEGNQLTSGFRPHRRCRARHGSGAHGEDAGGNPPPAPRDRHHHRRA
jgi:Xaa-Pro aminopeptidase